MTTIKLPEVPDNITKLVVVGDPEVTYFRTSNDPDEWVSGGPNYYAEWYTLGELLVSHPEGLELVEETELERAKRYFEEEVGRIDEIDTDEEAATYAKVILEHVFDQSLLDD